MILVRNGAPARRDALSISNALYDRPARMPDYKAENRVLVRLIGRTGGNPAAVSQTFAEAALELCDAGSSGVSLFMRQDGKDALRPAAVAGTLEDESDGSEDEVETIGRLCLDRGEAVLVAFPTLEYANVQTKDEPIVEALVVPLHSLEQRAIGTLWIAAHDAKRRFDAEDLRLLTTLATLLGRALDNGDTVAEHELLLQELRHRAINDLQMVASLLSLQRDKLPDAGARIVFDDVVARIQTIARVRATTTSSSFGPRADLSVALREVCLASAAMTASQEVSLTVDMIDEIEAMHPDKVLILALVVNELVTNAIKHAFPHGRGGHIEIMAWRAGPTELGIRVRDDGVAFDAGLAAMRSRSLGFQLIERLLARLDGRLVYPRGESKDFVIRAPLSDPPRPT